MPGALVIKGPTYWYKGEMLLTDWNHNSTNSGMNKMATIFTDGKSIWLKFHWSLVFKVYLSINQHWFKLGTEYATSHYMNGERCLIPLGNNELIYKDLHESSITNIPSSGQWVKLKYNQPVPCQRGRMIINIHIWYVPWYPQRKSHNVDNTMVNRKCHPGGQYRDYYPGISSCQLMIGLPKISSMCRIFKSLAPGRF